MFPNPLLLLRWAGDWTGAIWMGFRQPGAELACGHAVPGRLPAGSEQWCAACRRHKFVRRYTGPFARARALHGSWPLARLTRRHS